MTGLIGTSCPPTGRSNPCSKGAGRGKAKAGLRALAILSLAPFLFFAAACSQNKAGERRTPSGYPVPRYLSLKFGEVNARAGPSEENRLLFVYRAKGLPLQVVAETSEWRRVCDPTGQIVWVHKRAVDGVRTVMRTKAEPLPLLAQPKTGARTVAYLSPKSIADFEDVKDGWVRIKADGVAGWAPQGEVWGATDAPQCR